MTTTKPSRSTKASIPMAKPARPDLDALIEFSIGMPIVRYSVALGYIDRPVRCRIADEALCHAETMQANQMRVILPSNLSTAIRYNGNAWIADSGNTLEQIQSDLDLHLRSNISQRAEAARTRHHRTDRLCHMRHARCDVAELLQIQNIGKLLSAWEEMRKQAMTSMPYRLSLANELRAEHPAANLNRHLVQIVHARISMIQAWSPTLATKQAEQYISALKSETNRYERELQRKHLLLCAKSHPAYRMRIQQALPGWCQPGVPPEMPRFCTPGCSDSDNAAPRSGMCP